MKVEKCPDEDCKGGMKKNTDGIYVCLKCGGAFVPKERHDGDRSIFTVH